MPILSIHICKPFHSLCETGNRLIRITMFKPIPDAMLDVSLQNHLFTSVQSGFSGTKREIILLLISGISLLISLFRESSLPFGPAWVSIILCGVPIILEAVIGLVSAFDIKADVLVSLALILTGGGPVAQPVLLNFIFYVIFTPIIATAMTKVMFMSENGMIVADAMNRIHSILDVEPLPEPRSGKIPTDNDIALENVTFRYTGGTTDALQDVTIRVGAGETVALVGPSGGGKTTVCCGRFDADAPGWTSLSTGGRFSEWFRARRTLSPLRFGNCRGIAADPALRVLEAQRHL